MITAKIQKNLLNPQNSRNKHVEDQQRSRMMIPLTLPLSLKLAVIKHCSDGAFTDSIKETSEPGRAALIIREQHEIGVGGRAFERELEWLLGQLGNP